MELAWRCLWFNILFPPCTASILDETCEPVNPVWFIIGVFTCQAVFWLAPGESSLNETKRGLEDVYVYIYIYFF